MRQGSTTMLLLVLPFVSSLAACAQSPVPRDAGMDARTPPFEDAPSETAPVTGLAGTTGQGGAAGDDASDAGVAGSGAAGTTAETGAAGTNPCPVSDVDAAAVADNVALMPNVMVSTIAGGALAGAADGTADVASLGNPVSLIFEPAGTLLVCDFDNDSLRRLDVSGAVAVVSTVTKQAGFQRPYGLALGADGTLFVDTDYDPAGAKNQQSGTIWKIDPATGGATVVVQHVGRPRGLAPLADNRLVLGDFENARVRVLDPAAQTVADLVGPACARTLDGGLGEAPFAIPYGVIVRPDGSIVVADEDNHRLRTVTMTGKVATFAGGEVPGTIDGASLGARFANPTALAVDAAGNVFVSDVGAHRIRRVATDGTVTTIAGDGTAGFKDGAGADAQFFGQEGLAVTADGHTLYVADGTLGTEGAPYNRIRKITLGP